MSIDIRILLFNISKRNPIQMIIIVTKFDGVIFVVNESTDKRKKKRREKKISKGMYGMWFLV